MVTATGPARPGRAAPGPEASGPAASRSADPADPAVSAPAAPGPARPGPGPEEFRDAMRHWATGVAVVTTEGPEGPHGMTVNSLLSVSLSPPTLLISLKRGSRTQDILERTGGFTVNVLAAGQHALADRFTGRREVGEGEFDGLRARPSSGRGGPELDDSLAVLTCRTTERVGVADHTLVIAEVTRVRLPSAARSGGPLIYADRRYRGLGTEAVRPGG
ncbi:flavin reductase family protein [Streptomyces sp. NPDC020141]|uniref:flavin reductase family protein n=1 Tax=Streptomyces sp. NPDC020141 TaxID=3365065 RepID=UPI0037B8C21C